MPKAFPNEFREDVIRVFKESDAWVADPRLVAASGAGVAQRVRASLMPRLAQPIIEVAWRHSGELGKIHYRAKRPDGSNRHLIAREGDALYELLDQHLLAIGYTGPKSAAEASDEH